MKSLFEPTTQEEILARIQKLAPSSSRQWGKMDAAQMLAHAGHGLEMALGIIHPKRIFIGRIIGPIFKKKYSDESLFDKSSPTSEELVTAGQQKNFDTEKQRLIELVKKFSSGGEAVATKHPHPFFGPLTPREWGIGMYKHIDHHLRQFGG
jgi:hypothetical protein